MIRDGVIIHEARNITFWNWQFDSELLTTATLAIMTTILAYQLSAACFNIEFGSKERGTSTACDIHKLMLTEYSSSPFEILAAVARLDSLDRLRWKADLPKNVKIERRDTSISKGVTFSLIILLFASPVFNLISTFIALQRDETVTFSQAKTGGVALGVDVNSKIIDIEKVKFRFQDFTTICDRIPSRVVGPATAVASFSRCTYILIAGSSLNGNEIRLRAETTYQGEIKVSVMTFSSEVLVSAAVHVDLASKRQLFRIQATFTLKDAAQLIHFGQEKLAEFCTSATQENSPHDEGLLKIERSNGSFRASKDFNCPLQGSNEFADVVFSMTRLALIDHDNTKVVNVDSISLEASSAPDYFDAGWLPFLVLRGRNVNVLPMALVLFLSLLLRILTAWIFNNDVDEGVEAILRYNLGIGPQESLLRSSRTVMFNHMDESGVTTHNSLQAVMHNQKNGSGTNDAHGMKEVVERNESDTDDFS